MHILCTYTYVHTHTHTHTHTQKDIENARIQLLEHALALPASQWTPEAAALFAQVTSPKDVTPPKDVTSPKDTLDTSPAETLLQDRVMARIASALLEFARVRARVDEGDTQVPTSSWDPKHVASAARFLLLLRARSQLLWGAAATPGSSDNDGGGGGGGGDTVLRLVQVVGSETAALLERSAADAGGPGGGVGEWGREAEGATAGGVARNGVFSLQQLATIVACLTTGFASVEGSAEDLEGGKGVGGGRVRGGGGWRGGAMTPVVLKEVSRIVLGMLVGGGVEEEEDVECVATVMMALAKGGFLAPASPMRLVLDVCVCVYVCMYVCVYVCVCACTRTM